LKNKTIAVGIGYVNLVFHNIISFILTPLMLLVWGGADFGIYKLLLAFMSYLMFVDVGVRNTIVRFNTEYIANNDKDGERGYISFLSIFYFAVSILVFLISIILILVIPNIYKNSLSVEEINSLIKTLPVVAVFAGVTLFHNGAVAIFKAHRKQVLVHIVDFLKNLVRFLVVFILLKKSYGIYEIVLVDTIIAFSFLVVLVLVIFLKLKIIPKMRNITKEMIKKVFTFTSVMFIHTLAFSLFWSLDSLILSILTSATIVGVYALSTTISNLFQSFSNILSQVIIPDIMLLGHKQTEQKLLNEEMIKIGTLKILWLGLPSLGFVVFGMHFIKLWVGSEFRIVYWLVLIVLLPQIFSLIQDVPSSIMYVKNKHKPLAYFSIIATVINLFITIVLVKAIGIIGAAIGTAFAFIAVYVIFTSIYYQRKLGFDMIGFYKKAIIKKIPLFLIAFGIGFLINYMLDGGWLYLILKIIIFTVIYFVLVFLLGLDKNIKLKILSLFVKKTEENSVE